MLKLVQGFSEARHMPRMRVVLLIEMERYRLKLLWCGQQVKKLMQDKLGAGNSSDQEFFVKSPFYELGKLLCLAKHCWKIAD